MIVKKEHIIEHLLNLYKSGDMDWECLNRNMKYNKNTFSSYCDGYSITLNITMKESDVNTAPTDVLKMIISMKTEHKENIELFNEDVSGIEELSELVVKSSNHKWGINESDVFDDFVNKTGLSFTRNIKIDNIIINNG